MEIFSRLFHLLETKPVHGYVASGATAGGSYLGRLLAEQTVPADSIPPFFRWCGYVTIMASMVGAILTAIIQVYRLNRERRGLPSAHPFERKKRSH